jgi:hypothetical protein|tara:strand:- start:319 stop:633 length:315 start_codon:yes stop_codon:yes gene_type:complete
MFGGKKIDDPKVVRQGELLSACMLQQSMFTVVGVGIGLAVGLQRKNLRPFVAWSMMGTLGDMGYGYLHACRPIIEEYEECKKVFLLKNKEDLQSQNKGKTGENA